MCATNTDYYYPFKRETLEHGMARQNDRLLSGRVEKKDVAIRRIQRMTVEGKEYQLRNADAR